MFRTAAVNARCMFPSYKVHYFEARAIFVVASPTFLLGGVFDSRWLTPAASPLKVTGKVVLKCGR